MENPALPAIAAALLWGYLWGAIPFGLILARAFSAGDLRAIGSGNIGATNVLRTGRKGLAAATLLLDLAKGMIPVLLAPGVLAAFPELGTLPQHVAPDSIYGAVDQPMLMAGLGAFLGHLYPVWLRFRGGKGVATYIGVLLGLHWPAALVFCALWLATALTTRYSSLSALVATLSVPVYYLVYGLGGIGFIAVISLLIYWKHRGNISRLLNGEETKIGGKS